MQGYGEGFRQSYEKPVKVDGEYDVTIEEVGIKGDGIARVKGFVVFVPNTKKGDTVRIKVTRVLRKFAIAESVGPASAAPAEESPAEETQSDTPAEEEAVEESSKGEEAKEEAQAESPAEETSKEAQAGEEPSTEETTEEKLKEEEEIEV